jgi:hypothetical protein
MALKAHVRTSDVRGYSRLAVDATLGVTRIVESMHHNIIRTPGILGTATNAPTGGITGLVYRTIRGVTRLVGGGIDAALANLVPEFGADAASPERDALLAALNGVVGDHLVASGNPLAIPMRMRSNGQPLELTREALAVTMPRSTRRILVLAHGLCMSDRQWLRDGHDHGAALAIDAGFTPVYLHYNSGLAIAGNGRAFADLLEALVGAWPTPVDELVLLGFSMGGLVARSACHYGMRAGHRWPGRLSRIVFAGTPHHGAPLEQGGHWVDLVLEASPYTAALARLGKIRSAGITDLRHGSVADDDGDDTGRARHPRRSNPLVPLPQGVACYAIAGSIARAGGGSGARLLGDGLVPLRSALGQHARPDRCLAIPPSQQWVGYQLYHLDLLQRKDVYAQLRRWLVVPRVPGDTRFL